MKKLKAVALTGRTTVHRDTLVMKSPPKAFPETSPFIRMTIHGGVYYVVYPTGHVYPMTTETSTWLFYDKSLFVFNAKYQSKCVHRVFADGANSPLDRPIVCPH